MFLTHPHAGSQSKSLVIIFASPLSARPLRFSIKYEPVYALKRHEMGENNPHQSDDESFVPDSQIK
jgi:hypothetical protein